MFISGAFRSGPRGWLEEKDKSILNNLFSVSEQESDNGDDIMSHTELLQDVETEGHLENQQEETQVLSLPRTTEVQCWTFQRRGQDLFRERLMHYWRGRCPLTGLNDAGLLRASHIIPWADCTTNDQRLDVYNGLLLSPFWDAAFDRGLVTFSRDGWPLFRIASAKQPTLNSAGTRRPSHLKTSTRPIWPGTAENMDFHCDAA